MPLFFPMMSWRQLLTRFQPIAWLTGTPCSEPPKRPPTFMNLPIEIRCTILDLLPFEDVVTVATVCRELRVLALCECKLWRELPLTSLDNVDKLAPFLHRAGKLGTTLWINGIHQHRLEYLANVLYSAVPALRILGLHFEPANHIDGGAMAQILYAIAKSAPLLEYLQLAAPDHRNPLSVLPGLSAESMPLPLPRLDYLEITAYSLAAPCSAFANVTEVVMSIAALCPFPQDILPVGPESQWANATLHAKFPAVRTLRLMGIEPGPTGDCTLRRLPYIDQPLRELELLFDPSDANFEDPETLHWLAESSPNVQSLVLQHFDCSGVRDAALMSVAGVPVWLSLSSLGGRLVEISVSTAAGCKRAVRFLIDDLKAQLVRILASPLIPVQELWLMNDLDIVAVLPLFAGYRGLEALALVYEADAPFPAVPPGVQALESVRMLRISSRTNIEIDCSDIFAFLGVVAPRITTVVVNSSISLLHPHVLPSTIRLGRVTL